MTKHPSTTSRANEVGAQSVAATQVAPAETLAAIADPADAEIRDALDEVGMDAAQIAELEANLRSHVLTHAEALGLSAGELAAMEHRAHELLRQGKAERALAIFVGLTRLNRFEARYFRGAGLSFHHLRNWGMAYGAYDLALATNPDDRISEALRAECLLYVQGKVVANAAFDALLGKVATSDDQAVYLKRAADIRQLLR